MNYIKLYSALAIVFIVGFIYAVSTPYKATEHEGTITEKHYNIEDEKERFYLELDNETIVEVDSQTYHKSELGEDIEVSSKDTERKETVLQWVTIILFFSAFGFTAASMYLWSLIPSTTPSTDTGYQQYLDYAENKDDYLKWKSSGGQ